MNGLYPCKNSDCGYYCKLQDTEGCNIGYPKDRSGNCSFYYPKLKYTRLHYTSDEKIIEYVEKILNDDSKLWNEERGVVYELLCRYKEKVNE